MLDFINCGEGPDPTRVHKTELDERKDAAVTRAGWAFKKGQQVFENYGQPNHIYLTYHGFALEHNSHDCALMSLGMMPQEHARVDWGNKELLNLARGMGLAPPKVCEPTRITLVHKRF